MNKRVFKKHEERKDEIMEAAKELFANKGYEKTSVNDVLKRVGIAKGTFYHYFRSKEELLESMVGKMTDLITGHVRKSIDQPGMNALDKLSRLFTVSGGAKVANKKYLNIIGKAIYSESNLLLRQKLVTRSIRIFTPILTDIIRQGVEERVFDTEYPEEAAELIMLMARDINESVAPYIFAKELGKKEEEIIERKYRLWSDAIERMIGAPKGSIESTMMKLWEEYRDAR